MVSRKQILLFLILSIPSWMYGQGCSDAGFCTMGAMKPDQPFNKKIALKLRSMEFSFYRATTTLSPIVYVATADLNFSLNSRNSFQIKLPYQHVVGGLGTTGTMGDISICFTRNIYTSDAFDLNLSLGGKIPSNRSDLTANGLPLPMYYQTSLGTFDLISGISLINRKWLLATGIQVPLNQNHNQFTWSEWANSEQADDAFEYNQAKDLRRGIDVMFRVERNFRFSRFNFSAGLLPIYRIKKDEFTKTGQAVNSPEVRVSPVEAKGLAMSAIGTAGYSFSVRSGIKILVGHKLKQRQVNPDGLTRELVSTVSYIYRF